jgi:hypothetical protein
MPRELEFARHRSLSHGIPSESLKYSWSPHEKEKEGGE